MVQAFGSQQLRAWKEGLKVAGWSLFDIGWYTSRDVSENSGKTPQIIHFNRVFHYKPSILGYHYFLKRLYRDVQNFPSQAMIWNQRLLLPCRHGFHFPPESLTSPVPAGPAKRGVKMTERFTTEIAPTFSFVGAMPWKIIQVYRHGGGTKWKKRKKYVTAMAGTVWLHVTSSGKRRMLQAINVVSVCRFFMTEALILGSKHFPIYLNTFIPIMSKNYGIPLYIPLQHRANKIKKALVC